MTKIKLALVAALALTAVACQTVVAQDLLRDPIRESYVIDNRFVDSGAYGISAYSDDGRGYAVPSRSYSSRYIAPTYAAPYSSTYTPIYTTPSYSTTYVAPRATTVVTPSVVTPNADYSVYGDNAVHVRGPIAESYNRENRFERPPVTSTVGNVNVSAPVSTGTSTYSSGYSSGELRDPIRESVVNENRFVNY